MHEILIQILKGKKLSSLNKLDHSLEGGDCSDLKVLRVQPLNSADILDQKSVWAVILGFL